MTTTFGDDALFGSGRPWVDVRALGAKGDGVTDDTTAIQSAINKAKSLGWIVFFPPGTYLIATGPLILYDNMTLLGPMMHRGEWWGNVGLGAVLKTTATTGDILDGATSAQSGSQSINSCVIGLAFEGSGSATSGQLIGLPTGTNALKIQDCSFSSGYRGIGTLATNASVYDIVIRDNFFHNSQNASIATGTNGGNSWVIEGNYFHAGNRQAILDNGTGGLLSLTVRRNIFTGYNTAGIAVIDLSTNVGRNLSIHDNYFESNTGNTNWGMYVKGGSGHVHDNTVNNHTGANAIGIEVLSGAFEIDNNHIITINTALKFDVPVYAHNNSFSGVTTNFAFAANVLNVGQIEKTGSGSGNYTYAINSYADVDGTNLALTVTVPTNWTLKCEARASIQSGTGTTSAVVALADGTTVLKESPVDFGASGINQDVTVKHLLSGDGNAHTIKLRWKAVNSQTLTMVNSSSTMLPVMEFTLQPPN